LIERAPPEKIQVLCIEVIRLSKVVSVIERIPLPRKSCEALLVIFKETVEFYRLEMASMAALYHPRSCGDYENCWP